MIYSLLIFCSVLFLLGTSVADTIGTYPPLETVKTARGPFVKMMYDFERGDTLRLICIFRGNFMQLAMANLPYEIPHIANIPLWISVDLSTKKLEFERKRKGVLESLGFVRFDPARLLYLPRYQAHGIHFVLSYLESGQIKLTEERSGVDFTLPYPGVFDFVYMLYDGVMYYDHLKKKRGSKPAPHYYTLRSRIDRMPRFRDDDGEKAFREMYPGFRYEIVPHFYLDATNLQLGLYDHIAICVWGAAPPKHEKALTIALNEFPYNANVDWDLPVLLTLGDRRLYLQHAVNGYTKVYTSVPIKNPEYFCVAVTFFSKDYRLHYKIWSDDLDVQFATALPSYATMPSHLSVRGRFEGARATNFSVKFIHHVPLFYDGVRPNRWHPRTTTYTYPPEMKAELEPIVLEYDKKRELRSNGWKPLRKIKSAIDGVDEDVYEKIDPSDYDQY